MSKAEKPAEQPEFTEQERAFINVIVGIFVENIIKGGNDFDNVKTTDSKKATKFPL